ncbi:MAG: hypothetical protein KAI47_27070, partial [Deltaproteobacteria bacterium]|nr:hypothetical protein [Deltaproteobacteria bacterium]
MRSSKLLISLLLPLLAGGLGACGRTAGLGSGSDGYQGHDSGPSPDFVRDSRPNPDTLPSDVGPRHDTLPSDVGPRPDWGPWPD